MTVNNDTILYIAKEVQNIAKEVQKLVNELNQANLLNTVYVNENTHSRILKMILKYSHNGTYPFFESFLKIPKVAGILPKEFSIGKIQCYNETIDRIDLLIEGEDYAIIIENKIYNAIDQDRQIERYLDGCIKRGYKPDHLYTLYLTSDGTKLISNYSLTDNAKSILGITPDQTGRFAGISFKYDLLPWLRTSIKDSKDMGSQINSALIQYTDYIAEMFSEGEIQSQYENNMKALLEKHGITTFADFNENIDAISKLSSSLIAGRENYCRKLAEQYISIPLKKYCEKKNVQLLEEVYSYRFLSIRISHPTLKTSTFGFHTESDGRNIYGISNLDVNAGEVLSDVCKKNFAEIKQYNTTPWWPEYRYPADEQFLKPEESDFWETVVPKNFASYVIKAYEEVEMLLQQDK